jgi:hypothetical protein
MYYLHCKTHNAAISVADNKGNMDINKARWMYLYEHIRDAPAERPYKNCDVRLITEHDILVDTVMLDDAENDYS